MKNLNEITSDVQGLVSNKSINNYDEHMSMTGNEIITEILRNLNKYNLNDEWVANETFINNERGGDIDRIDIYLPDWADEDINGMFEAFNEDGDYQFKLYNFNGDANVIYFLHNETFYDFIYKLYSKLDMLKEEIEEYKTNQCEEIADEINNFKMIGKDFGKNEVKMMQMIGDKYIEIGEASSYKIDGNKLIVKSTNLNIEDYLDWRKMFNEIYNYLIKPFDGELFYCFYIYNGGTYLATAEKDCDDDFCYTFTFLKVQ